ncbi:Sporulation and spore germination [Blastococcus fimeti]|nr:Sporulation and spore germination [Blastococcus fimeti]
MTGRRVAALALALVLAGCGVPTGGTPSTIAAEDVPYGLASPSPSPTPTAAPEASTVTSRVHWIGVGEAVVPRLREVSGTTRRERLASLLEQLAAGPTPAELDEELSTALPPKIQLVVTGFEDGTATIDLEVQTQELSGVSGRRAVAQIVLTATSVPGVQAVLLELSGEPIEAPLPAGALTAGPLTARDYAAATVPAPVAVPAPPPEATPAPPS